jgi:nicotinate phosphoribosyltransferase
MGQMVFSQFPEAVVSYEFINRGPHLFPEGFDLLLWEQIQEMAGLGLTDAEYQYLRSIPFLKPTYLDWLRKYTFDPQEIQDLRLVDGRLRFRIHGSWFRTIWWEVALMALISEMYFQGRKKSEHWITRIHHKADKMSKAGVNWIDFGTRRRFSSEVQEMAVQVMAKYSGFCGTSNPHLAAKYNLKPQGTCAHECFMAMQAKYGARMSNQMTLEHWTKEFNGDLAIMLPDTLTSDVFLKTLTKRDAKLFDGVRLDSGDLIAVGEKVLARYEALGIDPKEKILIPSDGLNEDSAITFHNHFKGRVKKVVAGIGTSITNDVFSNEDIINGVKPLNMVIKMTDADFGFGPVDVVKLSDTPGKHTGNLEQIQLVKRELGLI